MAEIRKWWPVILSAVTAVAIIVQLKISLSALTDNVNQHHRNHEEVIVPTLNRLITDDALGQQRWDEVIRRLDRMEKKMDRTK